MADEILGSLDQAYTQDYPVEAFMTNMQMIDEAMKQLGRSPDKPDDYPDYFDAKLMELIDAVPLVE